MSEIGRGLNKGVTRGELLIELLIGLIILAGVSYMISSHVTPLTRTASLGVIGATGASGAKGDQGLQGLQGLMGLSGNDGATGPKGATGNTGATGTAGATGINGANGTDGSNGSQGAPGAPGTLTSDYVSSYNGGGPVAIPPGTNWILSFPTQSAQHGSAINVVGSAINITENGTYLITSTGAVQKPIYEGIEGYLAFTMSLQESDNGGPASYISPDPLAEYDTIMPNNSSNNLIAQTFNISRIVTITNAPSTLSVVLHNNSNGGNGYAYAYDHVVNVLKVN